MSAFASSSRTLLAAALLFASPQATALPEAHAPAKKGAKSAKEAAAPAAKAPRPTRPWSDDVVYFVLVDRFADGDPGNDAGADPKAKGAFHGGDLKGLLDHLDEISSLGVTALWLNPLVKNIDSFVTGAGFPDWGYHGYWADDFSKLDTRFGTEAQLSALVEACHARGIKVLLDVVYNHAGYGSHYLTDPKFKGWLRDGAECGKDDLTSCIAGLPDFKTELPEVRAWLLDQQLAWAKRFNLDGFRLDTVKHVQHDFWQEHRKRTRSELFPGFFLLGEVWGGDPDVLAPWFDPDELDAGFDFGFQGSAIGFVQGRGRTVAFNRYLEQRVAKTRPGKLLAHFLSTHDSTGALFTLQGDLTLFRMAAVLLFTTTGLPVVYYGEEVARAGGEWPANRSDMPWGGKAILPGQGAPRDEALRRDYQKLIALRTSRPALSRGGHKGLYTEGDLYLFLRQDAATGEAILVAVNRGAAEASASVPTPAGWGDQAAVDLFQAEGAAALPAAVREGANLKVTVPPKTARILGLAAPAALR
jgi:alpha-amylase